MQFPERLQRQRGAGRIGSDGEGERIKKEIGRTDAIACGLPHNPLGDVHPALDRIGDAFLVQCKGHQRPAVFTHQRKDGVHHRLLSGDAIDQRTADIDPHSRLQRPWVGGIQLQRNVADALHGLYHARQTCGLIDFRQAHIHIQRVRPGFRLSDSLAHHGIHVALAQRLLQTLFAGGIEAFADDDRPIVQREGRCTPGDHTAR